MKQKILSFCMAMIMLLSPVLSALPVIETEAAETDEAVQPKVITVSGADVQEQVGSVTWNGAVKGTETDSEGNEVSYCHLTDSMYANGLWNVTFDEIGVYKMSFLAAAKKVVPKFYVAIADADSVTGDESFTELYNSIEYFSVTDSEDGVYNHYQEFDTPELLVNVRTPGTYTFKIGNWRAWDAAEGQDVTDIKLAEIRFEQTFDYVYPVKSDATTEVPGGLLNWAESGADYMDYKLDVAEAGDYTLTYHVGNNWGAFGETRDAFQAILNPGAEDEKVYPAQMMTSLWADVQMKQTISLEEGEQILRIHALTNGFPIQKIAISKAMVSTVSADTVIPVAAYSNGAGSTHLIEGGGNISYTAEGLKLDYEIAVEKSGIYTISYNYLSLNESELITQVDGTDVASSPVSASAADPWYAGEYADTDTAGISFRLEKGTHTLSTVWGAGDINVKSINLTLKTPDPDPVSMVVEAEDLSAGNWEVTAVQATGDAPGYLEFHNGVQWANGRWIRNFEYAGEYKVQFVVATTSAYSGANFYLGVTSGPDASLNGDAGFTNYGGDIAFANTSGEYVMVDGPTFKIDEPGYYDIKFGNWGANPPSYRLDKMILTCENPVAPPDTSEPLVLEKGSELVLKEALAVNKEGSLRANPAEGNYVDYVVNVAESGDYRVTYSLTSNEAAVEDAFRLMATPIEEGTVSAELKDADFAIKLEPVQMAHYYESVQERQRVHLDAGSYVIRIKALNGGFGLTQLAFTDTASTTVSENGTTTIEAEEYNHSTGSHAIQGSGCIGYGSANLTLDYDVHASKRGIYEVIYKYLAGGAYSLTTQRVEGEKVYDLDVSRLQKSTDGSNDWYSCNWEYTEPAYILLPEGDNTFRVRWDNIDINVDSFTLTYKESVVEHVTGLVEALPQKDELTLADEAAVEKAQTSYDSLTDEEKAELGTELSTKLADAVAQIPVLKLQKVITDNQAALNTAFGKYVEADYTENNWEKLKSAKAAGLAAIAAAQTADEADKALSEAKAAMAAVLARPKTIAVNAGTTTILAQSKAYRKNGSLNTNVVSGNYVDYFIDVAEAGLYTFSYALYADEAVENAFAVKYDANEDTREYPETVTNEYAKVSVPKVEAEGNLVKEIRGTIELVAGPQTIRFEALSDKVCLNKITIEKQQAMVIAPASEQESVYAAADFTTANGQYVIAGNVVSETADGTELEYAVSVEEDVTAFLSYRYAYEGEKEPELVLSSVSGNGVTELATIKVATTYGVMAESGQETVTIPAGTDTLRITIKNDGVELKNFILGSKQKNIPATAVSLNAYRLTMNLGKTFLLQANVTPADSTSAIIWSSDKPEVASVSAQGLVTANATGTAVITVRAGEYTAKCAVTVKKEETPWQTVTLNAGSIRLNTGGTYQLTAAVEPNVGTVLSWKSSNPAVATVDNRGLVKAVKSGNAVITVTTAEGSSATCQVTVADMNPQEPSVPSFIRKVELELSNNVLYVGGNINKKAKIDVVVPTGAKIAGVTYDSSKKSVATVSAKGTIKAKKAGTTVITVRVTLTNGESASIQKKVTVKKAYIKLKKAKYTVRKGKTIQLKATAYGSSKKITYSIADKKGKKLAKITKSGKLTGKAKGKVKIIAKSGKVKKTFTVTIK